MAKIGVSIVGGTGYGAGELLRLLANHPEVEVASVISSSNAGQPISSVHQQLASIYDYNFEKSIDLKKLAAYKKGFVIAALPHGVSAKFISEILPEIKANKLHLVDLSGDFRLKDQGLRNSHYPNGKEVDLLSKNFVFGLPEINREKIANAQFVANPGCFALTSILALAPLASLNLNANIAIDGKSGSSGAGRSLGDSFHHPTANSNAFAYRVLSHRHEPEIAQGLNEVGANKFDLSFVPHVIPCSRGIYITAHVFLDSAASIEAIYKLYKSFYRQSPFVRIREKPPELNNVIGSNYCDISMTVKGNILVVTAATDNLIKGMCGTAIQNINLMSEIAEDTGLKLAGMGPV
jgi:N-acetyl-gamma-glutamyl-phosphate reductase